MNKIYKVIFNRNKNRYEIVSELASSRGGKCKVKAGKQIGKLFMTGLLATFLSSVALAAEQEVVVKYDDATGMIKIVDATDESQVLASYAVGGSMTPIIDNGNSTAKNVIALGQNSTVLQSNTIAIGTNAHAGDVGGSTTQEDGKIAIGNKTVASGDRSIALGNMATTNKGSYNIVQGDDSIGIGTSTSVFGYSGVSIGRRNIIGVPDPNSIDVTTGKLTTKSNTPYREADPGGNSVIVGAYNVAYGNRSNVIGTYSRAMGNNSVAIGSGVQSLSDGAIAIGKGSGYEFEDGSRKKTRDTEYYGRDWELPPEYKVLKQVLSNDIAGDKQYKGTGATYENGGILPKYNNYGAGSSDPGGFIVEGKNALGIGTYTQVRGDSAIGLATGEMTAKFPDKDKDKSAYARDMRKIMDMEETLYDAKEALKNGSTSDKATLEANVKTAEESLAAAKKEFRKKYLSKYSFVEGNGALGVGRQILAQGDRSMAVGDFAKAISNDAIAYGGQTLANGTNSMAMGGNAHVGTETDAFNNSMAIGSHTDVQAKNAVALGAFSKVTGTNSLALGFGTQSSTDSNNITYNSVSGHDSTLIGSYGNIAGNNSILIGSSGSIANDRVVGLGNNINIEAADPNDQENNTAGSVFLGDHAGYVKDSKRSRSLGQVDVVGSAGKMELTESLSSTKGALRDYTKDFIYIYMLERQDDGTKIGAPIAVRSDFAGGDSTVGVVSVGSTYEQKFNGLKDIQAYHEKFGSLITVPVEDVTVQVSKNGISLGEQKQTRYFAADAKEEDIKNDSTLSEKDRERVWNTIKESLKKTDTTYTVFETRRIQNVAPGLIGVNSTDAINGSQLFATNQMLGNLVGSLKKTFGDNVTITEDGQISVSGEGTLGWIAKANTVDGSNGKVTYDVDKETDETEEAYQARKAKLQKDGYIVDAAKVMTFKAGKNIGLVQKPGELSISTIDTPSFKSVELRGETQNVDGNKVTPVTMLDSSGMQVYTETVTPGDAGPTTTKKVSTTVNNEGVTTDGTVKVTNGKDGDQAKDLVTIGKNVDPNAPAGTDGENGTIGLDGKNGSSATITVDRGTSSLDDTKNIGTDPNQDISENNPAKMDRITYTTTGPNNTVIDHEVATMDDGLFFSGDSADGVANENGADKNTFARKLSQETKIIGGVDLGLTDSASAKERQEAIAAKLTDGNIGVISDGSDTLTVKLAKNLMGLDSTTYTSPTTKTGDGNATSTMKVDGNGVRFVGDNNAVKTDAPSLTTDGITGGNKTITDVASGIGGKVKDPDKNNANTFLENVNKIGKKDGDQPAADSISENVVVNAKDLKNLVDTGFKLNTSGQGTAGASTVKIGDTINVVDGANTKVSAITAEDGTHTFHIDVTGMPISYTDNEGNALTKIGDKYYKNTDIENGKPKTNATEVLADEVTNNIKVINKDGTTNNQGTISNVKSVFDSNIGNGADTGSKIDEIKDGSVISNTGSNQFINDLTKLNDQADLNATDAEAEKTRAKKDEEKLNSVSTVRDLQKVALTPLFFEGDVAQDEKTANTFDRKLSEKTKIVGEVKHGLADTASAEEKANAIRAKLSDGNIGVVSNGTDTLTIKLAKNLVNLTSVETGSGNNKTKMTENGITTTVKDGDTFKVTTTTPNGLATTEVKLDSDDKPTGESTTTMVTTDGVTITTQTPKNGDKPASTTETKLSKDGLATDGTVTVTNGKDGKDLVTIGKGTVTDPNATDKEFGTVAIDGKNGSKATLTVDRGTKSVTDSANVGKDSSKPVSDDNQAAGMDRLTYTTTGPNNTVINHEVATLDDGFFLTTEHTEKNKTRTVLFNNTIKVLDGANTKVSAMGGKDGTHTFSIDVTGLPVSYTVQQDSNTTPENVSKVGDTYQLANGTKLVKVGDKFYKPDQLVNPTAENPTVKQGEENKDWKLTNNVSLVNPNGGKDAPTLSNVGSALKKSNGTRITMSDLDDGNVYPIDNPIWNNAVNVGDLKAATDAARTEVTGTGEAFVTDTEAKDGHIIYNVHVDKILSHKDAAGNELVRGGDGKYYTNEEIKDKTYIPSENKWYSNRDITDGKPNKDAQAVTPNPVDQSNVKTSLVNPNTGVGTGTDTSMILDNVKSGIGGDAGNGIKDGTTVDGTQGNNTFIKNLDKVGGTGEGAIDKTTVVNAGDLKNLADTPLFFSGDAADGKNGNVKNTFGRKLSEEAKIIGGVTTPANLTDNNIGVVSNGSDTLTIKLAKQLTGLDSATYTSPTTKTDDGDVTSTMKVDGNGIRFVGDNNAVKTDAPSLTTDGIDGGNKQITNIDSGLKNDNTTISISDLKDPNKTETINSILNNAVNVSDLKNLVDTGFKLNTSGQGTNPADTVKIGDTINIIDGANTKVSAIDDSTTGTHTFHIDVTGLPVTYTAKEGENGQPVDVSKVGDTYQLADGTKLVKYGNKFYKPNQIVNGQPVGDAQGFTINDDIRLVNPNNGTGPVKITNVAPGVGDNDAVNMSQLKTLSAGSKTEVTGTGAAEVTKVTGANGQNIYNVHVDKLMEAKSTEPGKTIVRGSDNKYYYVDDALKQANDGKWYPADQVGADGKPADGAVGKDTTELTVVPADKLKNSLVNPNGEGPTVLDNVKSGIGGKVDDPDSNHENTFMKKVDTIGKANGISENTVVNAGDLKNLVDTGFKLNTSGHSGDAQTVKIGETIKVVDGANTKVSDITPKDGVYEFHIDVTGLPMTYTVSQTGGTDAPVSVSKVGDTYQLADGTKLVKVGDKFYKPSQLVNPNAEQLEVKPEEVAKDWTVNDSISLVNKEGSDKSPTLKNVGSGLKDANGNATTLDQAVGSNAVNVDDLRTMGKAATTEVIGTGAAEVTKVTGANGQNIYNVHVERFMQVAETDVEGNKVVKAADNHYYKEADIKDKTYIDGQWYNNTDIKDKTYIDGKWYSDTEITDGKANPDATELTVQATTAPNKAVGLQNNLVNPNDNTPTRLSNLASALSGEVGNGANTEDNSAINGIDKNGKPTSESGSNTFVKNVLDLDATEKTVEQLKTSLGCEPSEDEVKAEKARAEKDKALLNSAVTVADLQKTLQSPLFFEGDSADGVANENGSDKNTFARKLSQKTKIVGGVDLGLKENATAEERKKAIAEKLTDHNIGVISNGTDTLTIKLAKDLTDLHSVTTTDDKGNTTQINGKGLATTADDGKGNIKITTVTSDGITIVTTDKDGNNSVSLTNKGLDNGHHQIINVKSGLLDRQGKPVTLKKASGDILNNAVNVKDLRDVVQSGKGGGFGLTGNNGEVRKSLGETITLKGGIANKIENGIDMNKPEKATTDKNTYIDVKTSENGSEKIMVVEIAKDLTDLNSAEFTDQKGNTTKMKGDGIYIDKNGDGNADISLTSEGLNNGGNKITNVADGTEDTDAVNVSQLNKLKQEIKQNIGDEINELNAYAPVVYTDKDGNRVIRKGNKFVQKNDETVEILPQDIRLSLVNADGKTTTPSTLQNVAEGVQDTDAVNVKQLKEATEKPLTFNGDAGSSSAKLGETVAIKGGANSADLTDNNIGVIANSSTKTLNVKLSKKLKGLESAEFVDNNGNTTNITGDGVHISGGNGSNVSLTSQGLNNGGNRITNVAPGVEATDAVNVSQLNQVGAALHNRINNVAKGAYGGVASAGAMASLPQAYLPGKSMVAAGASHYRGESAVALGASRISDNGKIILKLNASHNTSGNTMVGAGVGYQF